MGEGSRKGNLKSSRRIEGEELRVKNVVLITGVSHGIGRATAEIFRSRGWDVVGVDKIESENAAELALFIKADLSSLDTAARIKREVESEYGRLDALVNNAAVQICRPFQDTSLEVWEDTMAVNVRGAFLLMREMLDLMKGCHASIVNVCSVHAVGTSPGMAAYVASKGSLAALTRAAAVEFAEFGVRVNAVHPGAIDTLMLEDGMKRGREGQNTDETKKSLAARHPLGRIGRPEDVGHAIMFLSDREVSSFITGQVLIVDGGALAKLSTE
jgi:NAD(P)-dependent dehydrogenase (short-subunit alcohol dehydrogenase family)